MASSKEDRADPLLSLFDAAYIRLLKQCKVKNAQDLYLCVCELVEAGSSTVLNHMGSCATAQKVIQERYGGLDAADSSLSCKFCKKVCKSKKGLKEHNLAIHN